VYAHGAHSHGQLFYVYKPTVGSGHTFTAAGHYPANAVSAWNGTITTSAVYQNSTGAFMGSTESLATGSLSFTGPALLITAWASDSRFLASLSADQGFTMLGSQTNFMATEIVSHAYFISP
jgi:hypothetical protein